MPFHNGLLPREGFKMDTIIKLFRSTALNPVLLAIPLALARFTERGQDLGVLHSTAISRAKILFYIGVIRWLSHYLSKGVLNNWTTDEYDWRGREIVLVTGGSSGIGAKIVEFLAELRIKTVILDIQEPIGQKPSGVHFYKCDITSPSQIANTAQQIRAQVGQPTVLINNAGVARGKTILDSSERDVRFTFDVNTLSHYWLAKEFLPHMISSNHGMIITVASIASWVTAPNMVDYASSKAAALAFHEGLAAELPTRYNAPKVRTIVINQGYTRTPLFEGYNNGAPFLLPSLEPDTVAQLIVQKMLKGESGQVIAPAMATMLTALAAMPYWYQYRVRRDGQNIMPGWKGKQVVSDLDKFYKDKENEKNDKTGGVEESAVLVAE